MSTEGISGNPAVAPRAASHRSPSLDAQLETVRGQLQDWVTCPSSKTPEGKAKIRQITEQFEAVKQQIKKADDPQGRADTTTAAEGTAADGESSGGSNRPRRFRLDAPMGGYLDVSA